MTDEYARFQRMRFDRPHPKVLRITMDNGKLNVADATLHAEMSEIWRVVDRDPDVHAAIITGAGRAFSAGGDFAQEWKMVDDFTIQQRTWREARDIVYNIINCSKPIISAINGAAVGAGIACALIADISIAAKDAKLIDGHTKIGVAAGDHSAIIWPLLCGMARAKHLLLLCETITGEQAAQIGLVSMAVEADALQDKALEVATRLAEGSQSAIRWTKYSLNNWLRQAGPIFDTSLALEFFGFNGPDIREGLTAFQEKRKPNFEPYSPL